MSIVVNRPRKRPWARPSRPINRPYSVNRKVDRVGIVNAYRDGELVKDIADTFGVNEKTVVKYARLAGIPSRNPARPQLDPEAIDGIVAMKASGRRLGEIANAYGITYGHVKEIVSLERLRRENPRVARLRNEIVARASGGERDRTIAKDLGFSENVIGVVRREALGPKTPPSWSPEEEAAIRGFTTSAEAIRNYRKLFPTSSRSDGAIQRRLSWMSLTTTMREERARMEAVA